MNYFDRINYPKKFYVKSKEPFEKIPEWKVVEIQGELNLRDDKISETDDDSKPNVQKNLEMTLSDCILNRKVLAGRSSATSTLMSLELQF